ncbi:MAG: hypothetical protein AB2L13_12790 [Spirochaetota bacterium]
MRKVYTAIFTLSIAACLAIANISTLSSQEKALKKLYISSMQASGVPEPLAKKARERIEFALFSNGFRLNFLPGVWLWSLPLFTLHIYFVPSLSRSLRYFEPFQSVFPIVAANFNRFWVASVKYYQ